jgi:hypothetical protein
MKGCWDACTHSLDYIHRELVPEMSLAPQTLRAPDNDYNETMHQRITVTYLPRGRLTIHRTYAADGKVIHDRIPIVHAGSAEQYCQDIMVLTLWCNESGNLQARGLERATKQL